MALVEGADILKAPVPMDTLETPTGDDEGTKPEPAAPDGDLDPDGCNRDVLFPVTLVTPGTFIGADVRASSGLGLFLDWSGLRLGIWLGFGFGFGTGTGTGTGTGLGRCPGCWDPFACTGELQPPIRSIESI